MASKKKLDQSLFHLQLDTPAQCAEKLFSGNTDLGLVPVAIIPLLPEKYILSDFCIGANGAVASVNLYSNVPLTEMTDVVLDYQSRTSVMLTKVLAKNFWKINVNWHQAEPGFETNVKGTSAALVIGDRTFALAGKYKYVYDLAAEWHRFTQMPFVFACWVANKNIDERFIARFNEALAYGINNIAELIPQLQHPTIDNGTIADYLQQKISYWFDDNKKAAMQHFLRLCNEL